MAIKGKSPMSCSETSMPSGFLDSGRGKDPPAAW